MSIFRKAIFTAASPNTQADDAFVAFKQIISPWNWYNKENTDSFRDALSKKLEIEHVHLVDSGRSALYTALKALEVTKDDEVLVPSFTCVVVANAVLWSGATPKYFESNQEDFNADYKNIEKYITHKTRAILVQHTFGKMVDVEEIKTRLKKIDRSDTFIIEDFAHTISSPLPLKGDMGFLTFGIEKVISSVRGGAVITKNKELSKKLESVIKSYPIFSRKRIFISLANPLFWWVAIPLHSVGIGRVTVGAAIRIVWRKLGFLGIMVEHKENKALKPDWIPALMPGALAVLGEKQLSKLDFYNQHRKQIAEIYHKELASISDSKEFDSERVYLRYPLLLDSPEQLNIVWETARSLRITLGNWFSKPLYGNEVDSKTYQKLCYVPKTTPITLNKTTRVLNLPTSINISKEKAKQLALEIKKSIS